MTDLAPILQPARYAKGKIAVRCPPDGSGYKTRAMRLCSAVSSRWSGREKAYIMSPGNAARVMKLWHAGIDGDLGDRNGKLGWIIE